jgi:hypothetical protein
VVNPDTRFGIGLLGNIVIGTMTMLGLCLFLHK